MVANAAEPPAGPGTFNKDVLPLLQKNCQTCHRPGQIAPFSLLTYENARPMAMAMKNAVVTKKMPPWNADPKYGRFLNDRSLKQTEIDAIVAWADQGAPEGEAKDKSAPVRWPEAGWGGGAGGGLADPAGCDRGYSGDPHSRPYQPRRHRVGCYRRPERLHQRHLGYLDGDSPG